MSDLVNGVSKELVVHALLNNSMSKYCLPFSDLLGEVDIYTTDFVQVYVSNRFSMNGKWFTAAGRFSSEEACLEAQDHLVSDMNRHSFQLWNFNGISGVSARLAFQDYVDSQREEANWQRCGISLALNGSGDSYASAVKCLRLSNELTKAKSQIAE
jgi:hypothetical protein